MNCPGNYGHRLELCYLCGNAPGDHPHECEYKRALEKIVRWDEIEKPHENIPLLSCAYLARKTLGLQ